MRKLMLILIAFLAVVTFIRAFDSTGGDVSSHGLGAGSSEHISNVVK